MADTGARTLRLLSLLQHRPTWSGHELTQRLAISARTLRRDVERLRELGYPVRARPGVAGGYELAPGAALPPLVLDDDEALALVMGLHLAASQGTEEVAEASMAALAKVVAIMPVGLRRRVDAFRTMAIPSEPSSARAVIDPATLATVAVACRNHERITFGYTDREGAATEREVEPHRMVLASDRWYLVAFDTDRHDWRTFRVDRLHELRALTRRFHPRPLPGDDAAAFVAAGLMTVTARHTIEVQVDAPAGEVMARIGRWATVSEMGSGRCQVTVDADSLDWAAFALGTLGADFHVVAPPEFAGVLRDWSDRFAAAIDDPAWGSGSV